MDSDLKKVFYKSFWINLITMSVALAIFLIGTIATFINFLKNSDRLYLPVSFATILMIVIILALKTLSPLIKDYRMLKRNNFLEITGLVVKYRKVIHGGEPETIEFHPMIRDEFGNEVELKVDNTELNQKYLFQYLKNTKIAVIVKKIKN